MTPRPIPALVTLAFATAMVAAAGCGDSAEPKTDRAPVAASGTTDSPRLNLSWNGQGRDYRLLSDKPLDPDRAVEFTQKAAASFSKPEGGSFEREGHKVTVEPRRVVVDGQAREIPEASKSFEFRFEGGAVRVLVDGKPLPGP
jgi:hypothetical protein